MHRQTYLLKTCGKYLDNSGKLARISGLNIVNLTEFARTRRSNNCNEAGEPIYFSAKE